MSNFGVGQWGRTQLTLTERTGTISVGNCSRWDKGRNRDQLEPSVHQTCIRELAPHQADTVRLNFDVCYRVMTVRFGPANLLTRFCVRNKKSDRIISFTDSYVHINMPLLIMDGFKITMCFTMSENFSQSKGFSFNPRNKVIARN